MEISEFAEIEKSLSREQSAVLHIVFNLHKKETDSIDQVTKTILSFEDGLTAQQILNTVKAGDVSVLPVPTTDAYKPIGWTLVGTRIIQGEEEEYTVAGSNDIRIVRNTDGGIQKLRLFMNNQGSFAEMETDLAEVLGNISYPIAAEDRKGYTYENTALKTQRTTS